jgi:hypothetical protein
MDSPSRPLIRKGGKEVRDENDNYRYIDLVRSREGGDGAEQSSASWLFEAKPNRPERGHVLYCTGCWSILMKYFVLRTACLNHHPDDRAWKEPGQISSFHHSHQHSRMSPAILSLRSADAVLGCAKDVWCDCGQDMNEVVSYKTRLTRVRVSIKHRGNSACTGEYQ